MNKFELIIFSALVVIAVMVVFDFITYIIRSAPKKAIFSQITWFIGLLCTMALIYWYMNGRKFL